MTEFFLGPSNNAKKTRLTVLEKQDIIRYKDENPSLSFRYISEFFSKKLNKQVEEALVRRAYKNREKILNIKNHYGVCQRMRSPTEVLLMDELNEEISIRNTLSGNPNLTERYIRTLALELAGQDKYEGYFANYKFREKWVRTFRKLYNRPLK